MVFQTWYSSINTSITSNITTLLQSFFGFTLLYNISHESNSD